MAILAFGLILNGRLGHAHQGVLGYATDISVQNLLTDTNQQRTDNGEATLALNAQLDQAAQAKANDMATRDYWSHNTPDGQTPWSFITTAGYSYSMAGENLAYGFTTTADTITGWMNSPEHRANILNTGFKEVGFGVIDIANYQNSGAQTLVVAMYASPASVPAPVAAVAPPAAPPSTYAARPQSTSAASGGAASDTPAATNQAAVPATNEPATKAAVFATPAPEPKQQRMARIQLVAQSQASIYAVSLIALATIAFFIIRHGRAWHKTLVRGERFVLRHPALDAAGATLLAICLTLGQTSGLIR